jgi:Prokaryotic N-terminal methylation motif
MSLIPSGSEHPHSQPSASAGFSLVEVLAALVVTMLLVLAFTPFAGQMLATWARGGEVARLVDLKSRGIGRLREDLRHAIVWTGFGERERLATFRGTETSISFPTVAGLGPGRSGLEMLSITVDTSIDGRALVRRSAAMIGTTFGSFQDPVVLFSGPFRYHLSYYARDGRELPIWDNQIDLPARIKLTIADHRGAIFSAPIELPTYASLSAACLASANLPGCPVQPKQEPNEWMKQYGLIAEDQ